MEETRAPILLLKIYPELRRSVAESKDVSPAPEEHQRSLTNFINSPEMTVFRDATEYLDIPKTRNFFHLKLVECGQDGKLDLQKTFKRLRDASNPSTLKIFSNLEPLGRFLLKSLTYEQIDYLSNYSKSGIRFYSRSSKWTRQETSVIAKFHVDEFWTLCRFPADRISNLYGIDEDQDWFDELDEEEMSLVRKIVALDQREFVALRQLLTNRDDDLYADAIYVLENGGLLGQEDKDIFRMSNEEKKGILKGLSPEVRDLLDPKVLRVAGRLSRDEIEMILMLRGEQINAIAELDSQRRISEILREIPDEFRGHVKPVHRLGHEEELLFWKFDSGQRMVLSKFKDFHLVRELNDFQIETLLDHLFRDLDAAEPNWNLIQRMLIENFQSLTESDRASLRSQPREVFNELRALLLNPRIYNAIGNLSVSGRLVLEATTRFDDEHLITINRSSARGLMILVETNWLTGGTIENLDLLTPRDRKYLLNLTSYERMMFKRIETPTIVKLKENHPDLIGRITRLTERERTKYDVLNGRAKTTIFHANQIEFDTIAALTEIDYRSLFNLYDEFRRTRNAISLWPIFLRPENLIAYLFDNIPRILRSVEDDLVVGLSLGKLLAEFIVGLESENVENGLALIRFVAARFNNVKLACGFYLNLYHRARIEHPYSKHAVFALGRSLYDFKDLAWNYDLRDPSDAGFVKSMPSLATPDIVLKVWRRILPEFARTDGRSLALILGDEVSGILPRELEKKNYALARATLSGNSEPVARLIATVLGKDRCFALLKSDIDRRTLDEFPVARREGFVETFGRPNFFEFAVYFRSGKIGPLLEGMAEDRIDALLGRNREKVLELMADYGFPVDRYL